MWQRIKKNIPFFKEIINKGIPTLGICFGHQLLAYILGSEIIADSKQKEVGTYRITLTKEGKRDRLFKGIPEEFLVQEAHKDSVAELPKGAELLAVGEKCRIQAFRFGNIYAVQFHPELETEDIRFRLNLFPDYNSGNSKIILKPSPFASKVLENFVSND